MNRTIPVAKIACRSCVIRRRVADRENYRIMLSTITIAISSFSLGITATILMCDSKNKL